MFVDASGREITDFDAVRANDPKALMEQMLVPQAGPGVGETFGAAFRQENIVGSFITNHNPYVDFDAVDPDWKDRWGELEGTQYEPYADKFMDLHNDDAWEAMKTQIDTEMKDRKTLQDSGWLGIGAAITAGLVDLPSLIPGGAVIRAANGGIRVLPSALKVAAYGTGAATLAEGALYATQELRTPAESAVAIGATTILSGMLGGAAARLLTSAETTALADKFVRQLDATGEEIGVEDLTEVVRQVYATRSLGAAADTARPELSRTANTFQQFLAKLQRWSPGMRGITYEVDEGADLVANMVETPALRMTNVEEGALSQPQAVETLMNITIDGMGNVRRADVDGIFKQARQAEQGMRRHDFNVRVAQAMRRGDVDPEGNEFVSRAARRNRKVLEHFAKEAQALGLLPEDLTPTTAVSYLSRIWDREKVLAHRPRLRAIIRAHIHRAVRALEARGGRRKGPRMVEGEMESYIDDVVDDIIDTISGAENFDLTRINYLKSTRTGPLQGRTLNIRDEEVEFFLVNDSEFIMDRYIRVMSGHVEFQRKFGTTNIDEVLEPVKEAMERLRAEAEAMPAGRAREKRLLKIDKQWQKYRRDVIALRDRLYGVHYLNERTHNMGTLVDAGNTLAYTAFGGLFALSSIPEMGALVLRDLVRPFSEDGVAHMVRSIASLKLNKADLQDLGVAIELIKDHRLSILTGTADVLDRGNPVRNFAREVRRVFSRASGLTYQTQMMKSVGGVLVQQRMLRLARQAARNGFDSLPNYQKQWMASLGVGREHAANLGKMFDVYGEMTDNGAFVPHTRTWDTEDAATANMLRRYQAAVKKGVDETVITPGAGDMPLYADSNLGRALALFSSYTFASLSRLTMNASISSKYGMMNGLITMTAFGTLTYAAREMAAGREVSNNPGRLLAEGVDRSGLLGMIGYGNSVFERSFAPGAMAGMQALFPDFDQQPPASRFAGRKSLVGSLAGPAASYIDIAASTWHAARGDNPLTVGEKRRAMSLVPGNNLFYLQYLMRSGIED